MAAAKVTISGTPSAAEPAADGVIRNLNGQKLGRKGLETRGRILVAAAELLEEDTDIPISLSGVARKAELGMTSLYLYFNDLTELLIALLEPVMATSEEAFVGRLRKRWPDDDLAEHCGAFIAAYHAFWEQHSRLLHLRNSMADLGDKRMLDQRIGSGQPIIHLLVEQMDGATEDYNSPVYAMASMLMTGLERSVTVWTDRDLHTYFTDPAFTKVQRFMKPAARLLELGVRDARGMEMS